MLPPLPKWRLWVRAGVPETVVFYWQQGVKGVNLGRGMAKGQAPCLAKQSTKVLLTRVTEKFYCIKHLTSVWGCIRKWQCLIPLTPCSSKCNSTVIKNEAKIISVSDKALSLCSVLRVRHSSRWCWYAVIEGDLHFKPLECRDNGKPSGWVIRRVQGQ